MGTVERQKIIVTLSNLLGSSICLSQSALSPKYSSIVPDKTLPIREAI